MFDLGIKLEDDDYSNYDYLQGKMLVKKEASDPEEEFTVTEREQELTYTVFDLGIKLDADDDRNCHDLEAEVWNFYKDYIQVLKVVEEEFDKSWSGEEHSIQSTPNPLGLAEKAPLAVASPSDPDITLPSTSQGGGDELHASQLTELLKVKCERGRGRPMSLMGISAEDMRRGSRQSVHA